MLSHSFQNTDVTVLLHEVDPVFSSVEEKEKLIQSGTHYSRLLSKESAPKAAYLKLFDDQVERFGAELAAHLVSLAGIIASKRRNPVLVSLVRAGTPIGVVLKRILNDYGYEAPHFSVSIVRDRGLDMAAIEHILSLGHAAEDIVFVDGWTGKGVIRNELSRSLREAGPRFRDIKDELYVVGDIAGVADYAATRKDTLIASCLLNAPVSGLISRSVTRDDAGALQHGAAHLSELAEVDRSLSFVNRLHVLSHQVMLASSLIEHGHLALAQADSAIDAAERMKALLVRIREQFGITDNNMIKPGIGESSRVLLRRVPDRLLVSSLSLPSVQHLIVLANERSIPVQVVEDMPISALAIIKDVSHE